MSQSLSSPQSTVERALALSRADDCMVIVRETGTANLRWAGSTLTTNGLTHGRSVTVIALTHGSQGTSAGVVEREGPREDELPDLVGAADAASRAAPAVEGAQPLLTKSEAAGGDWDAAPATTGIGVFEEFSRGLGRAFGRHAESSTALYGYAEHTMTSAFFGSSTGLRLRHDQPAGTVELNARSRAGANSAWVGRTTRDFTDVDADALDAELERRIGWGQRSVELPPGRYETLLPPEASADLLIMLYANLGARDALEGRTALSGAEAGTTRVGERLSSLPLTLHSDPAQPGLEAAPFVLTDAPGRRCTAFDNGLALERTDWIRDGELAALCQTRDSALRSGMALTPEGDNLVLGQAGASASLDDMVARTERGLLLTCLWYIREVDPQTLLLTGLTRDGVYLVEDGAVTAAVNNFRFNESPLNLLDRVSEVGATVPALSRDVGPAFSRTAMPPLRVADFNMSTVSQAV
ncbi:metallopeptidase TldD-related protein [Salinactinospora qingdaonensis]|uniref:Metallopeptidase TldD-related protein n=1 Tax=Salinactinospora qingdaonensis TaxID=702744 RepID=A0ABP7FHB5_9ACTN